MEGEPLVRVIDLRNDVGSQHLAKRRLARFVASRQEGTRVFYRIEDDHARHLVTAAVLQAERRLAATPLHHHSGSRTTP